MKPSQDTFEIDERPTKRRKLDRSSSTGLMTPGSEHATETPPRRQLRSTRSFSVTTPPNPGESKDQNTQLATPGDSESDCDTPDKTNNNEQESKHGSSDQPILSQNDESFMSQTSTTSTSSRNSLPNMKGKDLFDAMIWSDPLTTSIFYKFISSLRQKILTDVKDTTTTHKFIRVLRDSGRLVRNYTQNIDMLEAREGLCTELERGTGNRIRFSSKMQKEPRPENTSGGVHDTGVEVVHLHGSLEALRCALCAKLSSWDEDDRHFATSAGEAPECPWCAANSATREGKGRRSLAVGKLRPDIVLYGEEHPSAHLVGPLITHDISLGPDVLLILGTSLRVHGLKVMVKEFAKAVHQRGGTVLFVNQTKPAESIWGDVIDYWIQWDCDAWITDLKARREDIWLPQGTVMESNTKEEKAQMKRAHPDNWRPDHTSGAYYTHKILRTLGELAGLPPKDELTFKTKPLRERIPKAIPPKERIVKEVTAKKESVPEVRSASPANLPITPASDGSTKKRKLAAPRPNAVRENKENGAFMTIEILRRLRLLTGGPADYLLLSTAPVRKPKVNRRSPLNPVSENIAVKANTAKNGSNGKNRRQQTQLPSPPTSDGLGPQPPLTPKTQRIKRLGSISAILSSPLTAGRIKVWKDMP
jgi:NAD-dependent SIR2 family protein deacetylase